ncbi:UvrD-helicase domain-containing protein [Candidatus Lucifugimonas marina]|uniref:UvrD-helicase domain-containing protein n=1 Tax=Candidatus Lucifugimonas marina TaxID=3038979 RepID=UPI00319DF5F4
MQRQIAHDETQRKISELARIQKRHLEQQAISELKALLETDYVGAIRKYETEYRDLVDGAEFERIREDCVQAWITSQKLRQFSVDSQQASAIGDLSLNTLVTARAGSGKTSTLVNRTLFLQDHCGIAPNDILVLAFNRKAVLEIKQRLLVRRNQRTVEHLEQLKKQRKSGPWLDPITVDDQDVDSTANAFGIELPHVLTFHSLAYSLVHPKNSVLMDSESESGQAQSRVIQGIIDEYLKDQDSRNLIREVMLGHFRHDWDRIIEGGYLKDREDMIAFRRSLPRVSMKGEAVKSYGEKLIADYLFEHDVDYNYEQNYMWGGRNYRPDFTVFGPNNSRIVIEYFGMQGDPEYDEMSQEKRIFWESRPRIVFDEINPDLVRQDNGRGVGVHIEKLLTAHGIPCNQLSESEIWDRVKDRAIDRFTVSVKSFIAKARKSGLNLAELRSSIRSHDPMNEIERKYLLIAIEIYGRYLDYLRNSGDDDFDGLMLEAAEKIAVGKTRFERRNTLGDLASIQHMLIDEFQDFSSPFFRLISSIKSQNRDIATFCVGDNWQAINGFAGSDLQYFSDPEKFFGTTTQLSVQTNYRSTKNIVEAGNSVMRGRGIPSIASKSGIGSVEIADVDLFEPTPMEEDRHQREPRTAMLLRLISNAIGRDQNVTLLCRRNFVPRFLRPEGFRPGLDGYLEHIRQYFPEHLRNRISISTVHGFKGLESDVVIVLDAFSNCYPLIHPDWVFGRIFGDELESLTDEERRLFYVAVTRAESHLYLICDGPDISPFVSDLRELAAVSNVDWSMIPTFEYSDGNVGILISDKKSNDRSSTYEIRNQLKASGYKWNTGYQGWFKSRMPEQLDTDALKNEYWVRSADKIEMKIIDQNDNVIELYSLDKGELNQIW